MQKNWFRNKHLVFFVKLLLSGIALFFFGKKLWGFDFQLLAPTFKLARWHYLVAVALLMPLNWLLESWKWKWSVQKEARISLCQALLEVCVGIALGFFTPARVGEIIGRSYHYGNKKKVLSIALFNSVAQSSTTFFFGGIGIVLFTFFIQNSWLTFLPLASYSVFFVALLFLALFFSRKKLEQLFPDLLLRNFLILFAVSVLRYVVFIVQFFFIFCTIGHSPLFWEIVMAIGLYYLINTLVPVFSFAEIGVKASVALSVFPIIGISEEQAVFSALAVWFINLSAPIFIGLVVFLLRKKRQSV